MSLKIKLPGIPLKLDRRKVGDDYIYQKVNTETGSVKEYSDYREAIMNFFEHIAAELQNRGFRDSDFEEDDYCDEEFVVPKSPDTDRTDKRKQLDELFDKIKESAWFHRENEYSGLAERNAYNTMYHLFELYRLKQMPKHQVKEEIIKLRAEFTDFKRTEEQNLTIYYNNQDKIKRAYNIRNFLRENIETAPLGKLLLKCMEFISLECGETVTYKVLKRRLKNAYKKVNFTLQ